MEPIIRITSAPESYDGFGTETVEVLPYQDHMGYRFRVVSIPLEAQYNDWQVNRYRSGMYLPFTRETLNELIEDGLIKPAEGV